MGCVFSDVVVVAGVAMTSIGPDNLSCANWPTSFTVRPSLPPALSLAASTGVISGTPSAVAIIGVATYTLTAANAVGPSAPFNLRITTASQATATTPTVVASTSSHTTSVVVTWSGVACGGGACSFSSFLLQRKEGANSFDVGVSATSPSTVTGLTSGLSYSFQVTNVCSCAVASKVSSASSSFSTGVYIRHTHTCVCTHRLIHKRGPHTHKLSCSRM